MMVRNRIALIRLSEKLADNPQYAEQIGVRVYLRKIDSDEKKIIHGQRKENSFSAKEG